VLVAGHTVEGATRRSEAHRTEKSTASFAGYDPRSLPFDPGLFWANQVTKLRFASAFLDDERIALWPGLIRDAQNEDKR
jgi:hypothetical protein